MTELTIKKTGDRTAEFDVPEGCMLCGSTLTMRLSPAGAYSVCCSCRWIARADVEMSPQGLAVGYPPVALA